MKSSKTGMVDALTEHLLLGNPVTILDSVVLFGVPNLTAPIANLRKKGFVIHTRRVPYVKAISRVNGYANVAPPKNLPVKEILLTEYWVNK